MKRFTISLFAGLCFALLAPVAANADVEINETNFPDPKFRAYLLEQDYGEDGVITDKEIAGITSINLQFKQISTLEGIQHFTALTSLYCYDNQLTSLDVSNNTALTTLYCNNNQLTSLDLYNNTALTTLYCYNNQIYGENIDKFITSLPVVDDSKIYLVYNSSSEKNACTKEQVAVIKEKGWTPYQYNYGWVEYEGYEERPDIEINETNFPDENFRNWLLEQDYGQDGVITGYEIAGVTSISVREKEITSLEGIKNFSYLTTLYCNNNQLTSLDVSNNTALRQLYCYNNQLTSLDVSQNTALTSLYCSDNQLTSLDVAKNTALTSLYCNNNQQTSLDVSKNTALYYLSCYNNQLTSLDVSKNTALHYLSCDNNQLTSLDLSNNTALWQLYCSNNQLTSLDLSNNTALTELLCYSNQLTELDVTNNTALIYLSCYDNQLTSLDVTNNTALISLYCYNNQLTSLDVTNNTGLYDLYCNNNQLTSLDVTNNTALIYLSCYDNQLTELDVSNNKSLYRLYCHGNNIKDTNMDDLIGSLPNRNGIIYANGIIYIYDSTSETEGNVCTKSQVAKIKEKGWTPLYYNGEEWLEYEGSDDLDGIIATEMGNGSGIGANAVVYDLNGNRVEDWQNTPGIYIINGKKVVVK